jgi:hypothetical protein
MVPESKVHVQVNEVTSFLVSFPMQLLTYPQQYQLYDPIVLNLNPNPPTLCLITAYNPHCNPIWESMLL